MASRRLIGAALAALLISSPALAQVIPTGPAGLNSGTISGAAAAAGGGGSGDVVGPASAVSTSIPTYSGTTGKLLAAGSGLTVPTSGTLNLGILTATGLITGVGVTTTGAVTISGVTNDVTTVSNEDLRLRPNGTGRIRWQSGDSTFSWETSAGVATFALELSGTTARLSSSSSAGIYFGTDGTGGVQVGTTNAAGATNPVGAFSESISGPTTGTPVFSGFGAGKYGTRQAQAATCASDGAGTAAALSLDLQSSVVYLTNADANGCVVTLSETSAVPHVVTRIIVVSNAGGTVTFANTANVHAGPTFATSTGLTANDSYHVIFADLNNNNTVDASDLYVGTGTSDN